MHQAHNNVDALVWLDTSAEQHALYLQAFALARLRIEGAVKSNGKSLKPRYCVFTDCDETILDNSEYNAWLVATGRNFHPNTWDAYCRSQRSRACPGAVPFSIWLAEKGISLFFVTSRHNSTRRETAANLAALGFPTSDRDAEDDLETTNLFMSGMDHPDHPGTPWTKWDQYEWIVRTRKLEPILWLGDNLSDFRDTYKSLAWDQRLRRADQEDRENWGQKFIVMPNPVYGDWLRNYSSRDLSVLQDDAASHLNLPQPVRKPAFPASTPKMTGLEIWPHFT